MLFIVRSKESMGADGKMFLRLKVNHEFLHSNRADEIRRRVIPPQSKEKKAAHILFDLNYAVEPNKREFFALLKQLRNETPDTAVTFYYLLEDEHLIAGSVADLKELGYSEFLVAEGQDDYLRQLNKFILTNELHPASLRPSVCRVVGLLGGCGRIGTTTQAMQLLMFLQNNGYRAGLIQWQSAPELRGCVEVMNPAKHLSKSEFVINGLHFYGQEDLAVAKNDNDYLVFDFGNIESVTNESLAMYENSDNKIVVLGVKSKETHNNERIFSLDKDYDTKYIHSFILQSDKITVRKRMEERRKNTYFSDYTPDYFTYGGNDDMYSEILGAPLQLKVSNKRAWEGFKHRMETIRGAKWNSKSKQRNYSPSD